MSSRNGDGRTLLFMLGEFDLGNVEELAAAVDGELARGVRHVDVDISGTAFLDSAVLHALLEARGRVEAGGGGLRIVGASSAARRVFELAGLAGLLADAGVEAGAAPDDGADPLGGRRDPRPPRG